MKNKFNIPVVITYAYEEIPSNCIEIYKPKMHPKYISYMREINDSFFGIALDKNEK